jgi:hypothetical protein
MNARPTIAGTVRRDGKWNGDKTRARGLPRDGHLPPKSGARAKAANRICADAPASLLTADLNVWLGPDDWQNRASALDAPMASLLKAPRYDSR